LRRHAESTAMKAVETRPIKRRRDFDILSQKHIVSRPAARLQRITNSKTQASSRPVTPWRNITPAELPLQPATRCQKPNRERQGVFRFFYVGRGSAPPSSKIPIMVDRHPAPRA
jgi:hypothetical protein